MKHVFSNISDIAHMWAHQTQPDARTSRNNFFYDGDTIYSYGRHFPIAKHVEFNGVKAILFTLDSYSVTTAKHIHTVLHACNHMNVIRCLKVDICSKDATHQHHANFNYWLQRTEICLNKLQTARKPENYLLEISGLKEQAEKYAAYFEIPIPLSLTIAFAISNKKEYVEYLDKKADIIKAEEIKKAARERKKHREALRNWEEGKTARLYVRDGYDYLRYSNRVDGGAFIETTQGVTIPLPIAKAFYQKVKNGSIKTGDTIIDYEVSEVGKDFIQIGCHKFKKAYLIKFGKPIFEPLAA